MPEQVDCDEQIERWRKDVSEFLTGRKLNLVKVAGLQRLDENFCDKLGSFADGGYATLGVSNWNSLGKFEGTSTASKANDGCQTARVVIPNVESSSSRYIEDGSVPGCSGVQTEPVQAYGSDDSTESKKTDSSLDHEYDCEEFEDSEDEEINIEVSDDDSSAEEHGEGLVIDCVENGSEELPREDEENSSGRARRDSGKTHGGLTGSSGCEGKLSNGTTRDKNPTGKPDDRERSLEEAPILRYTDVEVAVARIHGEHALTEEPGVRVNGEEILTGATSNAEIENDEMPPQNGGETTSHHGKKPKNHANDSGLHPKECKESPSPMNPDSELKTQSDIKGGPITDGEALDSNNWIELPTKEDPENTIVFRNGVLNGGTCRVMQSSPSSTCEERGRNDDPESDEFYADECQATDGFLTADDTASDTDSTASFFDCEDDVSVCDDAIPGPDLRDHPGDCAGNKIPNSVGIDANTSDEGESSSASGSFDDTVMEKTAFEVTSIDAARDDAAKKQEISAVTLEDTASSRRKTSSVKVEDNSEANSPQPPSNEHKDSGCEGTRPENAVDPESRKAVVASTEPVGDDAQRRSSFTRLNARDAEDDTAVENGGLSAADRVPGSTDATDAPLKKQPLEREPVRRERGNDAKADVEIGKPPNDELGVEALSKAEAEKKRLSGLEKMALLLTRGCEASATVILGSLQADRERSPCLALKRKRVVKALGNCSQKNARIFIGMLKEHLLRVRYLVRTKGDSTLPVSAEVIRLVWDMNLVDYLKLEEIIDRTAIQLASPISKVISPAEIAERVQFNFDTHVLRRMLHAHLRKTTSS